MRSLTFEKNGFSFLCMSGVILIELKIYWTNVSFGLMFIKTINVQKDYLVIKCDHICYLIRAENYNRMVDIEINAWSPLFLNL